jgi:hypothetical protein
MTLLHQASDMFIPNFSSFPPSILNLFVALGYLRTETSEGRTDDFLRHPQKGKPARGNG